MAMASDAVLPLSAQIQNLTERVAACEAQLGHGAPNLRKRLGDLARKVEDIFKQNPKLQDLERNLENLDEWLKAEHAGASQILLHASTKRNYVVQHAGQLQEFAQRLREVEALESYVNTPSLQELPTYGPRLRKAEATSAVMVGAAVQLNDQVGRLAEDYHQAMSSLNEQLLMWDKLLSEKIGTGV
ncbi:unnamed protein product [Effrenium voratum]|nr:unnamed protein product [Effrenium voratum]